MNKVITLAYVNPPKEGRKQGSVKTVDGEYYSIPAMTVKLFQQGKTYEVEYTERQWEGKTFKTITNFQEKSGVDASLPASSPAPKSSGNGWDERSHRIERQHSQEMALRYFALVGLKQDVPQTTQLREMTSWFQRDIGHSPEKQQSSLPDDEPPQGEEPF